VIFGDKDTSSGPPEPLVAVIRQGLTKAGNKDVTVKIFANAITPFAKRKRAGQRKHGPVTRPRKMRPAEFR